MHWLVSSANPDDVTRFEVRARYTQRLVLTRAVCRELGHATLDDVVGEPAREALRLLTTWIHSAYGLPEDRGVDYRHGLDDPQLDEYASDLKPELELGTEVCAAMFMVFTADKDWELKSDVRHLQRKLEAYRDAYPTDSGSKREP